MIKSRAGQAVAVVLGRLLIRVLGLTWRVRRFNDAGWRELVAAKKPMIYAIWHGELLSGMYAHRGMGVTVLVSEHRDGELITRIIKGFDFDTVRGSTTRGASRALLAVIRTLEAGRPVAITPDGPRGPRHELQAGVLAAAQRANVPIVFVRVRLSRKWQFKSWDRFELAKPFARVDIAYSEPAFVSPNVADVNDEVPRFTALAAAAGEVAHRESLRG